MTILHRMCCDAPGCELALDGNVGARRLQSSGWVKVRVHHEGAYTDVYELHACSVDHLIRAMDERARRPR